MNKITPWKVVKLLVLLTLFSSLPRRFAFRGSPSLLSSGFVPRVWLGFWLRLEFWLRLGFWFQLDQSGKAPQGQAQRAAGISPKRNGDFNRSGNASKSQAQRAAGYSRGRKGKRAAQEDFEQNFSKVHIVLDMWEVVKAKKTFYDCPFQLWMDGQHYSNAKVSVFDPKDVFDKIKEEVTPYFENFL